MTLQHFTRCMIAGIVALLPIGGLVLTVVYAEALVAESWLAKQPFYFPGLGLIAVGVLLYVIGLCVTTFLGRWVFRSFDWLASSLPVLGQLYETLKQILGYGKGEQALFHSVVLVPSHDTGGCQIGLSTGQHDDAELGEREVVFVPGSPNPTSGRLVLVDRDELTRLDMTVNDALKTLVSIGKSPIGLRAGQGS